MREKLPDIYNLLQEIAWHFGSHGFDGECCENLSMVEFMALKKVYENSNFSIQEIGNTLDFTKSGATRIVNRLESKGYIIRRHSLQDGRVCCVMATPEGAEVITKVMQRYTSYLEDVLKELGPQKVESIRDTLETLVGAIRQSKPVNSTANVYSGGK